jgi:hypothetical protein
VELLEAVLLEVVEQLAVQMALLEMLAVHLLQSLWF